MDHLALLGASTQVNTNLGLGGDSFSYVNFIITPQDVCVRGEGGGANIAKFSKCLIQVNALGFYCKLK